jgi:hypothetical protein
MQVQDARRVREALEDLMAAVDRAAPDMTHDQLVQVGEQLEVVGRALISITTASGVETTAAGDQAHEPRSHRIGRDDQ